MRFHLLFALVLMHYLASGQIQKKPVPLYSEPTLIDNLKTRGYQLLNRYEGDLNLDTSKDLILIFGKDGEDSLSDGNHPLKRIFLLATKKSENSFQIEFENQNLVYYYNYDLNFKETFVDITFKKGEFTINHYGGFAMRWGRSTTFVYSAKNNDWLFERDELDSFEATDPETATEKKITTSQKTEKISAKTFDIYAAWK